MKTSESETSKPRRSVAWIVQGAETGGGQQATINLIKAVGKLGWRTRILSLAEGALTEACAAEGLAVECLKLGLPEVLHGGLMTRVVSFGRGIRQQRRAAGAVVERLRGQPPDVIHTIWSNLMVTAGMAARELDAMCIWEMAKLVGGRYPFQLNRHVLQWQAKRYGVMVLANSRFTAATFGEWPVKPVLFYLGADAERFDPGKVAGVTRGELGLPEEGVVLGIFARLVPEKGQREMIEALALLGAEGAGVHLLLLGEPKLAEYERGLRELAEKLGVAERVHFRSFARDVERYYPAIDVAVNSRIDAESFGLSVVEAMIMGKPVLAHACGGPAETVVDGVTGWLMGRPTVEAYAEGIRRVMADRGRWREMGRAGRERGLEMFTTEAQARRYMELVEGKRRGGEGRWGRG